MRKVPTLASIAMIALALGLSVQGVRGHGDVQPQAVDTTGLEPLGTEWKDANPYRDNPKAIEIGTSGYAQNCARCHGLQVVSGGLAPDLRYLDKGQEGDTWYLERVRKGAIINGVTKMPSFEGTLSQEALWAIRTYLEAKHES
ncbi:cytochrome c-550 PedF [Methylobacterium iners]|uniref:Cytochrome c domain-containing protein n=1 Tax=Methylobacterium iners TaxID=418707 RepID=A0ABQ4RRC0_9HYPH|nr:cytochrome c-550 PedF [Methylobacterium iners]GJD93321.1 hypothetical protein OCOJLMKI_0513 [Methylobacterium iners]